MRTMRRSTSCLALLALTLLPSCVYTNVQIPLDTDLNNTQLGDKTGTSSFVSILGLFAWGDAGTQAAAEQGGITTLTHADQRVFAILPFYYKQTTVVYGN